MCGFTSFWKNNVCLKLFNLHVLFDRWVFNPQMPCITSFIDGQFYGRISHCYVSSVLNMKKTQINGFRGKPLGESLLIARVKGHIDGDMMNITNNIDASDSSTMTFWFWLISDSWQWNIIFLTYYISSF